jgi:lycopene beta-cyclase
MIRGAEFFESSLKELESSGVSFYWDCAGVDIDTNAVQIGGDTLRFDCVIDASFQPSAASSTLWQSFAGMWVTTPSPAFDPTAAVLMDLHESSEVAPVSFLYLLPTSPTTALVEHTTFSPEPLPKEYHLQRCSRWIQCNTAGDVQDVDYEYGAIPMGLQIPQTKSWFVTGSNAGTIRPATGYAFLATQRYSQRLSEHLLRGKPPPNPMYARWLTVGDKLFLRALLDSPLNGEKLMEGLLSRAPAGALIAFLSGDTTFFQALSVWSSVPKMTMIKALLRI